MKIFVDTSASGYIAIHGLSHDENSPFMPSMLIASRQADKLIHVLADALGYNVIRRDADKTARAATINTGAEVFLDEGPVRIRVSETTE